MNMKNKHAVITGGANGIGRCIAEAFLREGAVVTVINTDNRPREGTRFYCGDIADKTVLEAFIGSLLQPVDYLINIKRQAETQNFVVGYSIDRLP